MTLQLSFLGAAGTVTGSKYLLDDGRVRLMVDCGLFQGFKNLRRRNWAPLPVRPGRLDAVVLTHAHLDHSGYLPLLARRGYAGPVYATRATGDLCEILLPDSGFLQERDAEFANRHGFSKHHPALPLYTESDARQALELIRPVDFDRWQEIAPEVSARFRRAGHILGAAMIELRWHGRRLLFSGDLGRPDSPTMPDPATIEGTDYLVVESTYGDRHHEPGDPEEIIADVIRRTAARGGSVLVPAFAVGRTQILLYHLHRLRRAGRIPDLPIFLDSPMAIDASDLFCRHPDDHRLTAAEARAACGVARYVHEVEDSKRLDSRNGMPMVLLSASGMLSGGRILHHLKHLAPNPRNTILFTGYQAGGTRGAAILVGAQSVKVHGAYVPIRAEIADLPMLSAHADADEIMAWLCHFRRSPRQTFVTHGEPAAADALRHRIEEELGWRARVPDHRDRVRLR